MKISAAAGLVVGLGFSLLSSLAQGQQRVVQTPGTPVPAPSPTAPPISGEPQSTTAAFGDWVVRCSRQGEGAQALRICEVAQTIQVQGQQGPLAQIAFGRIRKGDPLKLTVVLPTNISLPSTVRIAVDEKDAQPAELAWRRCVPGACVADVDIAASLVQKYRSQTESGRIVMKDAVGRDVVLPISFRGLAQALDALARE